VYKAPKVEATQPVPREERVVEPFEAIVKYDVPVEDATVSRADVWEVVAIINTVGAVVEVEATDSKAVGVEVPIPTLPLFITVKAGSAPPVLNTTLLVPNNLIFPDAP
jgi:hypothetical protein